MRLILNLILTFLCTTLFSSENNLIYQFNERLPKEIFLQIIKKNIVRNFLSPTHPEEIMEFDRQLAPYKAVCKTWKSWLDQNVNFRDMENLFVGNYFWPPHEFVKLYSDRFKQKWYHPNQAFQDKEQRLVDCYQNACNAIDTIKSNNSSCISNDLCTILMHNDFYTPFYDLLLNSQLALWYNLLMDALKYHGPQSYKKICTIFAQQYLQTNTKIMLIEAACMHHFSSDVIEAAQKSLNEASRKNPFDYCNCEGALSLKPESDGLCMLHEYIQHGGFLTHRIYGLLPRLFLSQEKTMKDLRIQHCKEVEEIKGACDLNILLPYILAQYIKYPEQYCLFTQEKTVVRINYLTLLNKFYRLYLRHKNLYDFFSGRVFSFFKKYQSYFTQKDEQGRSFVYCLLLATFDKPIAMKLLSSFIQGFDQSHENFLEDERERNTALFKENFLHCLGPLSQTDRSILMTYFNIKEPDTLSSYGSIQSNVIARKYDEPILQPEYVAKIERCFFPGGICCSFAVGIVLGGAYLINALTQAGHPFMGNGTHI
jgi:hypothetical protein